MRGSRGACPSLAVGSGAGSLGAGCAGRSRVGVPGGIPGSPGVLWMLFPAAVPLSAGGTPVGAGVRLGCLVFGVCRPGWGWRVRWVVWVPLGALPVPLYTQPLPFRFVVVMFLPARAGSPGHQRSRAVDPVHLRQVAVPLPRVGNGVPRPAGCAVLSSSSWCSLRPSYPVSVSVCSPWSCLVWSASSGYPSTLNLYPSASRPLGPGAPGILSDPGDASAWSPWSVCSPLVSCLGAGW